MQHEMSCHWRCCGTNISLFVQAEGKKCSLAERALCYESVHNALRNNMTLGSTSAGPDLPTTHFEPL